MLHNIIWIIVAVLWIVNFSINFDTHFRREQKRFCFFDAALCGIWATIGVGYFVKIFVN